MKPPKDNPYEQLQVERDAMPEEIKAAYRKQAMEHHPDKGGDSEKFAALAIAYECLSDPKKRASYDRVGEYKSEMNLHKEIVETVGKLFINLLSQYGDDIFYRPVFKVMKGMIKEEIEKSKRACKAQVSNANGTIKYLTKVKKRLKRKAGAVPLFESILDDQIKDQKGVIVTAESKLDDDKEVFEGSIKFLKDFSFREGDDEEAAVRGMFPILDKVLGKEAPPPDEEDDELYYDQAESIGRISP